MSRSSGFLLIALALLCGCDAKIRNQPKYQPFEESDFFADGMASRPRVKGTVPRGHLELDDHLYRGLGTDGKPAAQFPFPIDAKDLARGREPAMERDSALNSLCPLGRLAWVQ